jgi:hypothetical protein
MDLTEIGRELGLTPEQTKAAFDALAPVVAAGLQRNGNAGGGLGEIIDAMTKSQPSGSGALTKHGNDVLGEIFKSKDVSRGVADKASATTGIGSAVLKKMLPIIASIVMAQLAKQVTSGGTASGGGGGLGDILGQILGGAAGTAGKGGGGGLGDILGQILGGATGGNQLSGSTNQGNALLDSVEKALRNR